MKKKTGYIPPKLIRIGEFRDLVQDGDAETFSRPDRPSIGGSVDDDLIPWGGTKERS